MKFFQVIPTIVTMIGLQFFLPAKAQVKSVVVSEIFADPAPAVGLPMAEFIELTCVVSDTVDLYGWTISDKNASTTIKSHLILAPDSIVIVTSVNAASLFATYGRVISVSSFPSLDNEADQITLYDKRGHVVHSVNYQKSWYRSAIKQDGGWTLEMVDLKNACGGEKNWKASNDVQGGTPGKINSVRGNNPDTDPPAFLRSFTSAKHEIFAVFDEPLDSISASRHENYTISGIETPLFVVVVAPLFNIVQLTFNGLDETRLYRLKITNVRDCAGNPIGFENEKPAAIPSRAQARDIVFNEILFNPKGDGSDYTEIYNRGTTTVNLRDMYISADPAGTSMNAKRILDYDFNLYPGEYVCITRAVADLSSNYAVKDGTRIINSDALPALPDDKGYISLLNTDGDVIDEFAYHREWHFALLSNDDGVALEKIQPDLASNIKMNWTSASSKSGFGTPGYVNSQLMLSAGSKAIISLSANIFSPDNDGYEDVLGISYMLEQPGMMIRISIMDINGNTVRNLIKGELAGTKGAYFWNGLGEQQNRLPVGVYVIAVQIHNTSGLAKKIYKSCTLARRF